MAGKVFSAQHLPCTTHTLRPIPLEPLNHKPKVTVMIRLILISGSLASLSVAAGVALVLSHEAISIRQPVDILPKAAQLQTPTQSSLTIRQRSIKPGRPEGTDVKTAQTGEPTDIPPVPAVQATGKAAAQPLQQDPLRPRRRPWTASADNQTQAAPSSPQTPAAGQTVAEARPAPSAMPLPQASRTAPSPGFLIGVYR